MLGSIAYPWRRKLEFAGMEWRDVLQECRLFALIAMRDYRADRGATMNTWVYRCVANDLNNLAVTLFRQKRNPERVEFGNGCFAERGDDGEQAREMHRHVEDAETAREIISEFGLEGILGCETAAEFAEKAGISVQAAAKRLRTAKRVMRHRAAMGGLK